MNLVTQRGVWFIALGVLLIILGWVRYNKTPTKKTDFWTLLLVVAGSISLFYAVIWFSGLGKAKVIKDTVSDLREEAGRIVDRVGDELRSL